MTSAASRVAVWLLRGCCVAVVLALALAAAATRLGPLLGQEVLVIRGGSMSPAIPFGTVVIASHIAPDEVAPGDIITFRGTNGVTVTHRVVEVLAQEGELLYRTKGDASASADPYLVPQGSLVGVVRAHLPYLGYLIGMLAHPLGVVSLVSALLAIYLAMSLLEEGSSQARRQPRSGEVPHGIPV